MDPPAGSTPGDARAHDLDVLAAPAVLLLIAVGAVATLLILILRFRLHAFIALLLVGLGAVLSIRRAERLRRISPQGQVDRSCAGTP
jgi:hypothetical protein